MFFCQSPIALSSFFLLNQIQLPRPKTLPVTSTIHRTVDQKNNTNHGAATTAKIDHPSSLVTTISDLALARKGRTLKIAMIIPTTDPSSSLALLVTTISDPAIAKGRITPLTLRNVRTFATPDHPSNLALLATRAPYQQKLTKLLTLPRGSIPIGGRNSSLRLKRHLPRRHRLPAKSLQRHLHRNLRRSAISRKSLCPPSVDPRSEEISILATTRRFLNGSLIRRITIHRTTTTTKSLRGRKT